MSPLSHAELITITGGTRESNPLFERFEKTYHNVVFRMYVVLLAILCLLGTHLFVFPTLLNPFMFIALSVYTLMGFAYNIRRQKQAQNLQPYYTLLAARILGDVPHDIIAPSRYLLGVGLAISVVDISDITVTLMPSFVLVCILTATLRFFVLQGVNNLIIDNRPAVALLDLKQSVEINHKEDAAAKALTHPEPAFDEQTTSQMEALQKQAEIDLEHELDCVNKAGFACNDIQRKLGWYMSVTLFAVIVALPLAFCALAGSLPLTIPKNIFDLSPFLAITIIGSFVTGVKFGHALRFIMCPFLLRHPYKHVSNFDISEILDKLLNRFKTGFAFLVLLFLAFYFDLDSREFYISLYFLGAVIALLAMRFAFVKASTDTFKRSHLALTDAEDKVKRTIRKIVALKKAAGSSKMK